MASWFDIFKVWKYATENDPLARKNQKNVEGSAVMVPDMIATSMQDANYWGSGRSNVISLRGSTDLIDLSSITNRLARYKEYERLRACAEIETALTVYADETCVSGDTKIATPFGFRTIKELANTKKPEEEFLVYAYDFTKKDYTLAWAYHPRLTKYAKTVRILVDDGDVIRCTPDHKILLSSGDWIEAGSLKKGDKLMPFYKIDPIKEINSTKFQRIYTHQNGWVPEKFFVDEWKSGQPSKKSKRLSIVNRCVQQGLNLKKTAEYVKISMEALGQWLDNNKLSFTEIKELNKIPKERTILDVAENIEIEVYDISVREHKNFCTDIGVFHNCQVGDNGHVFRIECESQDVKKLLDEFFFHPDCLNMDRRLWNICKNLFVYGDHFIELILDPENPKDGVIKFANLPPETMYRIETVKGRLVEFQQSKEGPDYVSLSKIDITLANEMDLKTATAIRFAPEEIIHFKIGEDRPLFYPYGISIMEAARGVAHQLRLMEDAMLVYRLNHSTERRVYYIDIGGMSAAKSEALVERLKDQLTKVKTSNTRGGQGMGNPVEERWVAQSVEENIFIPMRPGSGTRVDVLASAGNLGETDDAMYFRQKLYIALCLPKNYLAQEDPSAARVSLSSANYTFARLIERQQAVVADGLVQMAIRHLKLRGVPPDLFNDLKIVLTPPSNYRKISQNDINDALYNRAMAVKGAGFMSDYDIYTRILDVPKDDAKELIARATAQKILDLKLQAMASNPQLMGLAKPGPQSNEMGVTPGGPNPDMSSPEAIADQEPEENPDETPPVQAKMSSGENKSNAKKLPIPEEEDVKIYDLDIVDLSQDQDEEDVDDAEIDD
jgi:hypothetical protein